MRHDLKAQALLVKSTLHVIDQKYPVSANRVEGHLGDEGDAVLPGTRLECPRFSDDCSLVSANGEQPLSFEKLERSPQSRPADLETTGQLALAGQLVFPEPCGDALTHGLAGLHDEAVALREG
ncbi:MAG: hypothetical protein WCH98_01285 [Verrucomicrobiota bacterium]